MDFLQNTPCQFGRWAIPLALDDEMLGRLISEQSNVDEQVQSAYSSWSRQAKMNLSNIETELNTEYGLPELEMLRIEACFCIIQGHWQGAVCLTNILLEAFLKLALVYSNVDVAREKAQPLGRLLDRLSRPVQKYMQMYLNNTIDEACKQGLINDTTKQELHEYRNRFRNAFFHADMQKMYGNQTTPVTGVDFGEREIEYNDVAIRSLPMLLGEALWQNAQLNAIPYFKRVDALIRETMPKVFPKLHEE